MWQQRFSTINCCPLVVKRTHCSKKDRQKDVKTIFQHLFRAFSLFLLLYIQQAEICTKNTRMLSMHEKYKEANVTIHWENCKTEWNIHIFHILIFIYCNKITRAFMLTCWWSGMVVAPLASLPVMFNRNWALTELWTEVCVILDMFSVNYSFISHV